MKTITLACVNNPNDKWEKTYYLNGEPLTEADLEESLKIRKHSPDGFNHGYGGSGPAQLALAICLKLFGPVGELLYQPFKARFIASLPHQHQAFHEELDVAEFTERAAQYQCRYQLRSWQEEEGDWTWEETPAVEAITRQEEALEEARRQENEQGRKILVEQQLWQGDHLVRNQVVYQTPGEESPAKKVTEELVPYFPFGSQGEQIRFSFKGFWNSEGVCNLEIYRDQHTVVCTEMGNNEGTSITNMVEELAKKVCVVYSIDPAKLVWIERYTNETYGQAPKAFQRERHLPAGVIEECSLVTFQLTEDCNFKRPEWKHLNPEEVAQLKASLED